MRWTAGKVPYQAKSVTINDSLVFDTGGVYVSILYARSSTYTGQVIKPRDMIMTNHHLIYSSTECTNTFSML
jgi:hypothetical protein